MNAASTLNFTATASTAARQNIYGTLNYTSAAQIQFGVLDLRGQLNAQNAGSDTNAGIIIAGASTVSNGGYFTVKGALRVNGATLTVAADAGQSTLSHYSVQYMGRLYLINGGLVLNRADAFVTNDTTPAKLLFQGSNTVASNADNFFDVFYYVYDGTSVNLTIADGTVFGIAAFSKPGATVFEDGVSLVINDFDDGKFFAKSKTVFSGLTITAITKDSVVHNFDELEWVAGTFQGANGYYLNLAAIPEPSTWAAVLGVVAIAAAVCRRRK